MLRSVKGAGLALAVLVASGGACGGASSKPTAEDPTAAQPAGSGVALRFMEPAPSASQAGSDVRRWREIDDGARIARFRSFIDNEPAGFALALYGLAWKMSPPKGVAEPTLFIALEPGGNYSRVGFELITEEGSSSLPELPYLILDDKPRVFRTTLLHETGHAIHALLAKAGRKPAAKTTAEAEDHSVAPIPHSTAAVTDRRTAFNEGFSIHLETVNAHCGADAETRAYYQRRRRSFGPAPGLAAEYYAAVRDMMSYAQNFARYQHVRDGLYVFEAAPASTDYLRLQLDPARDRRSLRSGPAMMATEGVIASVLFHFVTAEDCASLDALLPRYRQLFAALRTAEGRAGPLDSTPLVEVIAALRAADPIEGSRAIFAFLDVTHGATMDSNAGLLWERLFDAAVSIDQEALKEVSFEIESRRRTWEREALENVGALARALGPVVVLTAPGREVGIALFGPLQPLSFDINAVGPGVLGLVPGITGEQVGAIVDERRKRAFASAADFFERVAGLGLAEGSLVAR